MLPAATESMRPMMLSFGWNEKILMQRAYMSSSATPDHSRYCEPSPAITLMSVILSSESPYLSPSNMAMLSVTDTSDE